MIKQTFLYFLWGNTWVVASAKRHNDITKAAANTYVPAIYLCDESLYKRNKIAGFVYLMACKNYSNQFYAWRTHS
jgi:hypothetical protein